MSLLIGYLNVVSLIQKYFPLPIIVNTNTLHVHSNKTLFTSFRLKLIWKLEKYTNLYLIIYSIFSLFHILVNWSQDPRPLEEIVMLSVYFVISIEVFVTMVTCEHHCSQCSWVTSRCIQLRKIPKSHVQWPKLFSVEKNHNFRPSSQVNKTQRPPPNLLELLAYCISIGFMTFAFIILGFSILHVRDPIQTLVCHLLCRPFGFPPIFGDILGGILLQFHLPYAESIGLSYLLLILAGGESTAILLPQTYKRSSSYQFQKCLYFYNEMRVIIAQVNTDVHLYVPMLISCGMGLCVWGLFSCIMLSHLLPLPICIAGMGMTAMVYCVILILTPVAASPLKESANFHAAWKCEIKSKLRKRQLISCRDVFFTVGPFFKCTTRVVLDILVAIMNWTFNLIIVTS